MYFSIFTWSLVESKNDFFRPVTIVSHTNLLSAPTMLQEFVAWNILHFVFGSLVANQAYSLVSNWFDKNRVSKFFRCPNDCKVSSAIFRFVRLRVFKFVKFFSGLIDFIFNGLSCPPPSVKLLIWVANESWSISSSFEKSVISSVFKPLFLLMSQSDVDLVFQFKIILTTRISIFL